MPEKDKGEESLEKLKNERAEAEKAKQETVKQEPSGTSFDVTVGGGVASLNTGMWNGANTGGLAPAPKQPVGQPQPASDVADSENQADTGAAEKASESPVTERAEENKAGEKLTEESITDEQSKDTMSESDKKFAEMLKNRIYRETGDDNKEEE